MILLLIALGQCAQLMRPAPAPTGVWAKPAAATPAGKAAEKIDRAKAAKENAERLDAEQVNKAQDMAWRAFEAANPAAHVDPFSVGAARVDAPDRVIVVVFDYSVINAYGAKAVHHHRMIVNADATKVNGEDDKFLNFAK